LGFAQPIADIAGLRSREDFAGEGARATRDGNAFGIGDPAQAPARDAGDAIGDLALLEVPLLFL
jgi:hypothetical protein